MFQLLKHLFLCFVFVTGFSLAGEMDACYQASFKQIDRVLDLPPEVIGLVYANSHGDSDLSNLPIEEKDKVQSGYYFLGIADRGRPFSSGCTPLGYEASLRLIMAASSDECIFVAIEHGGSGHGAGMRVFLRENDRWVRGDRFEHPRAQLTYTGKYDTDLPSFIAQSSYELGEAFKYGRGVKKDHVESRKWYSLSTSQGHIKAQSELSQNVD
jgi:TPR repeat protein